MQLTRRALLSSVPLRRGSNPCVLTLYRELIGTAVLLAAARWIDKSLTVAKPQLRQCALSGALFALIRLSVVFALNDGGADLTAALVPLVPVMTLGLSLLLRMERLRARTTSGVVLIVGMALCVLSASLMAAVKGPLAFGKPMAGSHAPLRPASGVLWMLVNTSLSACVQVHNKRILAAGVPVFTMTACISAFCVLFLVPLTFIAAHSPRQWVPTPWLMLAALYSGIFPTAVNNVLLSRANLTLGPTVTNLWLPLQPVTTMVLDYVTLGDAVYVGQLVCSLGVNAGLVMAIWGKHAQDELMRVPRSSADGVKTHEMSA